MNRPGHCWRCEAVCTQRCSRCGVAYYCSKQCQKQDKWRHQPNCDAAALKMQCSGCGVKQEGMLKCTNCLKSYYCNAECQRKDWQRHKTFCQKAVEETLRLVEEIKFHHQIKRDNPGLLATYYWLQSRSVLNSFGVVLMSCRVNFHVVRSALQYSACRI